MMNPACPSRRPAVLAVLLFTATLCLNACSRTPDSLKKPNMTALSPRLQPLFEKTRTVCFGRFVVEVPATATVVFGPTYVGSPITYYPGEAGNLAQHVTDRLKEVEEERDYFGKNDFAKEALAKFPMFGKAIDGAMPGQKLVFGSKNRAAYAIDSYIPVGNDLFVQQVDSTTSKDEEIASLNMVARLLRVRADDEIPPEPGICIEGGFIPEPPQYTYEWSTLGVRLKEFPDVHFSISATKKDALVESDALEPRLDRAEKNAPQGIGSWYSRIKFFRRGARQLGDWKGFEVLARKPAQENTTESHEFAFLSQGVPKDPLLPVLDIKLDSGVDDNSTASAKPSLTDEEAVALWDRLTTSIRPRPTGGAKHSAAEPAPEHPPLGHLVLTGLPCPQTGYWRCPENDVHGSTRLFRHGETMPPATVRYDVSFLERFKGNPGLHQTDTVWKLVRHDAPPLPAAIPAVAAPAAGNGSTPAPDAASGSASDKG